MSRLLIGGVASGMTLLGAATSTWAASIPVVWEAQAVLHVLAEPDAAKDQSGARQAVLDLLDRARQAMAKKDWDAAEKYLEQAEEMNVDFGLFHRGDTPKKVRRDLEKERGGAKKPSARFLPGFGREKPEVVDPFAKDNSSTGPERLPAVVPTDDQRTLPTMADRPSPIDTRTSPGPVPAAVPADDRYAQQLPATTPRPSQPARNANGSVLLEARKALAVGDTRRASELVERAKAEGGTYGLHDDSPAKIEAAIKRHDELARTPADQQKLESYQRRQAANLLDQAEALLRYGEFDEATRLANLAKRLPVNYGPYEATPDATLRRIAMAMRERKGPGLEMLPPVADSARPLVDRAATPTQTSPEKARVLEMLRQARAALNAGDIATAERIAREAESLQVPDSEFAPKEDRPWLVLLHAQNMRNGGVVQAGGVAPIDTTGAPQGASQAVYDPANDSTTNVPATALGDRVPTEKLNAGPDAMQLFVDAEAALQNQDRDRALRLFQQAYERRIELDPATAARVQDYLQLLSQRPIPGRGQGEMIDEATAAQQVLYRQISSELAKKEDLSTRLQENDPNAAMTALREGRVMVEASQLDAAAKNVLLRRVDRRIQDLDAYIKANRPQLELQAQNRAVLERIERERQVKVEVSEKLALLVDEFNKLMDERRFAEAEVVAKRARELAPDEPVVLQISKQVKFVAQLANNNAIRSAKEQGYIDAMASVDRSATPFDDSNPIQFPGKLEWDQLTKNRKKYMADLNVRRSEREIEIEQRLKTPVMLKYENAPLSQVINDLQRLTQMNIVLDPQGLGNEGVDSNTPVTIDLTQEISLKSALNLILEPLHLAYVIKNEVLTITSEQLRNGQLITRTYPVADLVIPIPNFAPSGSDGMPAAINSAFANQNVNFARGGLPSTTVLASPSGALSNAVIDSNLLANMSSSASSAITPMGPGGAGGAGLADFDSLIELIQTTVAPNTWDIVGGQGAISPFETNLSLVISNTADVHEDIADLLDQLRRLQDLQVTIEVRFITLNDAFFERIGVDFDFDIDDDIDSPFQVFGRPDPDFGGDDGGGNDDGINPGRDIQDRDHGPSAKVGLSGPTTGATPLFSADLDIPFRQGSFGVAVPQFGGFDAASASSIGFAILSDIEAYFFIEAAQGDRRSNILQAPKVTLFNGQVATVSDVSQSPFVTSVTPVVGDFAAAQQPIIVVLNEGTTLTVQAVVSPDRRFVRLTVVPFFSKIGNVDTFTFTGSSTTTEETDEEGPEDDTDARSTRRVSSREGTTVQLPTFSFVSVATTVSVPDGGTVLLGGVKRASEGRNEVGVPILSKVPYVNRLFRNVGIGRETQSLMLMVTPRIIIQEEEEELLGIAPAP